VTKAAATPAWKLQRLCVVLLLAGLEERVPLPAPTQVDPGSAQPSSPAGSGSCMPLPRSLEAALEALQDDATFKVCR